MSGPETPLFTDPFGLDFFPYEYRSLGRRCGAFIDPTGLSNMGVIEGEEGLVVIDSTIHPFYASRLVEQLRQRFSKPILSLINTHFHRDHTFGNQLVPVERGIVAHALCASYLERYGPDWLAGSSEAYRHVQLAFPRLTFTGQEHTLERFSVEVNVVLTGGHTHDSCVVYVPEDGVLFSGDSVFNRVPPYVAHWSCVNHFGRMLEWIKALELILRLSPSVIVPGHGELATPGEVRGLQRFFEFYAALVRDGVARGQRLKEIWAGILSQGNFQRAELEPEIYLHMTMGLHDELVGPPSLFEK